MLKALMIATVLAAGAYGSAQAEAVQTNGTARMPDRETIIVEARLPGPNGKLRFVSAWLGRDDPRFARVRRAMPGLKAGGDEAGMPATLAQAVLAQEAMAPLERTEVTADMAADGTVTVHLRLKHTYGEVDEGSKAYPPGAPDHDDIVALAGGLAPGETKALPGWPDAVDAPRLTQQLMALADGFGANSQLEDVEAVMGELRWSVDRPCVAVCWRTVNVGDTDPYAVTLWQFSTKLNSDNYHYDRPFEAEAAVVEIDIPDDAGPDACFSETGWAEAAVRAGWETPKPFTLTRSFVVTDKTGPDAFFQGPQTTIAVHGFVTRRGAVRMALMTGTEALRFTLVTPQALARLKATDGCLRVGIVDAGIDFPNHSEALAAYGAANAGGT